MSKRQIKVFLISLFFQFVISSLLYLGVKPPQFLSFFQIPFLSRNDALAAPQLETIDPIENLKPKLDQKTDNFALKTDLNLVPTVDASVDLADVAAWGIIDFDSGEVINQKNLTERLPIASLTKLMTSMVALDLASPDEMITVNQQGTTPEPSKLFLKVGEQFSVEKLLNFMLITSANDAAEVVKEGINQKYGADVFFKAMNYKAQAIGLKNTHFSNAQGFDSPDHYSSIEDLALLTHYALTNYPLIAQIVAKQSADFREIPGDNRFYLNNWNGLLGVYPGVMGVKIGNTDNAKHTDIVLSQRGDKKLLVVLLGAPTILDRDLDAAKLLDSGFEKFNIKPAEITEDQLKEKYASWKSFE